MGPSFIEAAKRGEMKREIERLKESVDYHRILLASVQDRLTVLERPRVEEFTARDAYSKAIEIVTTIKNDPFKPLDDRTREWINATLDDVLRALKVRLDRCGGKP